MQTYKLLKPPLKVNVSRIFQFQRGQLLPLLHKPDSDGYSKSYPSGESVLDYDTGSAKTLLWCSSGGCSSTTSLDMTGLGFQIFFCFGCRGGG